jgi:hypothetical protein
MLEQKNAVNTRSTYIKYARETPASVGGRFRKPTTLITHEIKPSRAAEISTFPFMTNIKMIIPLIIAGTVKKPF